MNRARCVGKMLGPPLPARVTPYSSACIPPDSVLPIRPQPQPAPASLPDRCLDLALPKQCIHRSRYTLLTRPIEPCSKKCRFPASPPRYQPVFRPADQQQAYTNSGQRTVSHLGYIFNKRVPPQHPFCLPARSEHSLMDGGWVHTASLSCAPPPSLPSSPCFLLFSVGGGGAKQGLESYCGYDAYAPVTPRFCIICKPTPGITGQQIQVCSAPYHLTVSGSLPSLGICPKVPRILRATSASAGCHTDFTQTFLRRAPNLPSLALPCPSCPPRGGRVAPWSGPAVQHA